MCEESNFFRRPIGIRETSRKAPQQHKVGGGGGRQPQNRINELSNRISVYLFVFDCKTNGEGNRKLLFIDYIGMGF